MISANLEDPDALKMLPYSNYHYDIVSIGFIMHEGYICHEINQQFIL